MATTTATQTEAENAEAEGEEGTAPAAKLKLPPKLIMMAAGGLLGLGVLGFGCY